MRVDTVQTTVYKFSELSDKAKVQSMGTVDSDFVAYQYIQVPQLTRNHCDMAAFRNHPKYGGLTNSDMFPGVLKRIRADIFKGVFLRLDKVPANVTIDDTGFLAVVTIEV